MRIESPVTSEAGGSHQKSDSVYTVAGYARRGAITPGARYTDGLLPNTSGSLGLALGNQSGGQPGGQEPPAKQPRERDTLGP